MLKNDALKISETKEPRSIVMICGGGEIVSRCFQALRNKGYEPYIIGLEGSFDTQLLQGHKNHLLGMVKPERVGALFHLIENLPAQPDIMMIGSVKRPHPFALRPDLLGLYFLIKLAVAYCLRGDNALLKAFRAIFETRGYRFTGVYSLLPEFSAQRGIWGVSQHQALPHKIVEAWQKAKELGLQDQGQSVVLMPDGAALCEDKAGTDMLIKKASKSSGKPVLFKLSKPQQDLDLDQPTIGPQTIQSLKEAGFAGCIIEAHKTIVVDQKQTLRAAKNAGLFVVSACDALDAVSLLRPNAKIEIEAPKKIAMIAGEESGDILGGDVMNALRIAYPDAMFSGIGGEHMQAQGLKSLFDMRDLSVMGLAEVLPSLRLILKRLKQTKAYLTEHKPDIVISIDAPDFSFRVQKSIKAPLKLHYVAPTVWAWRPKRAERIAQFLDGIACLFDFEPPYFEREGLASCAVGHPMTRQINVKLGREQALERIGLDGDEKIIAVFFGSRRKEASMVAEHYAEMMAQLIEHDQQCKFVMPVFDRLKLIVMKAVERYLSKEQIDHHCIFIDPKERYNLMHGADYAVATSGTVGLELAYAGTPHCIAYRMGKPSYWLAKRLVKTPYAHIGNIICGREVFKEFLQDNCTAQNLSQHVNDQLGGSVDDAALSQIRAGISAVPFDLDNTHFYSIDDKAKEQLRNEYKRGTLSDTALAFLSFIDQQCAKKRLLK